VALSRTTWTSLAYHGGLEDAEKKGHWCGDSGRGDKHRLRISGVRRIWIIVALEAAVQCGFLRYLIVDEAHLVASWATDSGRDFKPSPVSVVHCQPIRATFLRRWLHPRL